MLSYTTLEDAYSLSLTGQKPSRKKRREETSQAPNVMTDSQVMSREITSNTAPTIPPAISTPSMPIISVGNNSMIAYIVILVVLVFAGMIYDMRSSLHDIQQTLKIIASGAKLQIT